MIRRLGVFVLLAQGCPDSGTHTSARAGTDTDPDRVVRDRKKDCAEPRAQRNSNTDRLH